MYKARLKQQLLTNDSNINGSNLMTTKVLKHQKKNLKTQNYDIINQITLC